MGRIKGGPRGGIQPRTRSLARKAARNRGFALMHRGNLGEGAFIYKAISLCFTVATPYGHNHPYDFVVDGGGGFHSVQVKTCAYLCNGLYQACINRHNDNAAVAYKESEVDFVAVFIIPEDTWYILPVREVVRRTSVSFRPKGYPRGDPWACYREAWHLLRHPDGLTFG